MVPLLVKSSQPIPSATEGRTFARFLELAFYFMSRAGDAKRTQDLCEYDAVDGVWRILGIPLVEIDPGFLGTNTFTESKECSDEDD